MTIKVSKITNIKPHPSGNPKLCVAQVDENQVVVGDHYYEGQLGFFLPEGTIVPEKLLREMWLWNSETGKGRLGGKKGNKVKARIWEGEHSAGLFYGSQGESWAPHWAEGLDITKELEIESGKRANDKV